MATKTGVTKALRTMVNAGMRGVDMSPEYIDLAMSGLSLYSDATVQAAAERLARDSTFFPSIAELRRAVKEEHGMNDVETQIAMAIAKAQEAQPDCGRCQGTACLGGESGQPATNLQPSVTDGRYKEGVVRCPDCRGGKVRLTTEQRGEIARQLRGEAPPPHGREVAANV